MKIILNKRDEGNRSEPALLPLVNMSYWDGVACMLSN